MRLAALLPLAVLFAACRTAPDPRAEGRARASAQARKVATYYERLLPFERTSLEAFGSDAELERYLDAAAFMKDTGVIETFAAEVPELPRDLPRQRRAAGPRHDPGLLAARAMMGLQSYGPWPEPLSRLVQRAGHLFVLHENQVRSFTLDATTGALTQKATLTLGPPPPERLPAHDPSVMPGYSPDAFAGAVIFDQLFATKDGLVLLGNRQDCWAIELVRVAVGVDGSLRAQSTQRVHYAGREVDGYRARVVDDALLIYLRDAMFRTEGAARQSVYALPAISTNEHDQPRALVGGQNTYRPLVQSGDPHLHTLLRCPITSSEFVCSARALVGPEPASFLMGDDAVYLWLVGWRGEGVALAGSWLVRLPFDGAASGGLRVRGQPPQSNAPSLHLANGVLYAIASTGEPGELALIAAPLTEFAASGPAIAAEHVRRVQHSSPRMDATAARFVGSHLVWGQPGDGEGYFMRMQSAHTLDVLPLSGGPVSSLPIAHAAAYVRELAGDALVIGTDSWNLHVSLIDLHASPARIIAHTRIPDAVKNLDRHGGGLPLVAAADAQWFALDITPKEAGAQPSVETLVPMRWTRGAALLMSTAPWSAPLAPRSPLQPRAIEHLQTGAGQLVLRVQAELRSYALDATGSAWTMQDSRPLGRALP